MLCGTAPFTVQQYYADIGGRGEKWMNKQR
jgi:hypothetical protein